MDPDKPQQNQQEQPQQMFASPDLHPSQYDFITNPVKPPKKSLFGGAGKNKSNLLIMIAAGLVGFMILVMLVSVILGGSSDKDKLLLVAQQQTSLIALADLGEKKAGDVPAQSLASSVKLAVSTDLRDVVGQLGKVKPKEYTTGVDSQIAANLTTAETNGRFDEAFMTAVQQELLAYQRALQTASSGVSSPTTKQVLSEEFTNAGVLLSTPSISQ